MRTFKGPRKRNPAHGGPREEKKVDPDVIRVVGVVQENLPNTLFRVKLGEEFGQRVLICYLSGKMRKNYIKIMPGDRVEMEISRYDPGKGRIVYRK